MSSLKSRFVVPALLAGAAVLTGCDRNEKEDFHGMTNAVQGLCVADATESQKWACVAVADEQATFLANYVGAKGEFKKSCDFSKPPEVEGSVDEVVQANALRINVCLDAIDKKGTTETLKVTSEIRRGLTRGL